MVKEFNKNADIITLFPDKYKIIPDAENRIVVKGENYWKVIMLIKKYASHFLKFVNSHVFYDHTEDEYHIGLPVFSY